MDHESRVWGFSVSGLGSEVRVNPRTPEGPFNRALMVLGSGYLPLNPKPQTLNPKPGVIRRVVGGLGQVWGLRFGVLVNRGFGFWALRIPRRDLELKKGCYKGTIRFSGLGL